MRDNKGSVWVWIILILAVVGIGFLIFRDMLIKKQKHDLAVRAQYVNELIGEIRVNLMLCRMVLQETGSKDDSFAVNVKALKKFMLYMSTDQDIFTVGEQATERINELKKRFDMKNMLSQDGFQVYISPKDAGDVMDMLTNMAWLMEKAEKNNFNLNF